MGLNSIKVNNTNVTNIDSYVQNTSDLINNIGVSKSITQINSFGYNFTKIIPLNVLMGYDENKRIYNEQYSELTKVYVGDQIEYSAYGKNWDLIFWYSDINRSNRTSLVHNTLPDDEVCQGSIVIEKDGYIECCNRYIGGQFIALFVLRSLHNLYDFSKFFTNDGYSYLNDILNFQIETLELYQEIENMALDYKGRFNENNYHNCLVFKNDKSYKSVKITFFNENEAVTLGMYHFANFVTYSSDEPLEESFLTYFAGDNSRIYKTYYINIPENCKCFVLCIPKSPGYSQYSIIASYSPAIYYPINESRLTGFKEDKTIRISAYNSSSLSKSLSDFVCSGTNDEITIQNALDSIGNNGTIILEDGDYFIDSFSLVSEQNYAALLLKNKGAGNIIITGTRDNQNCKNGAILWIRQSTYDTLETNNIYSIIRHNRIYLSAHLTINHISFEVYNNQKKIICIDSLWSDMICMNGCTGMITSVSYLPEVGGWGPTPPSNWINPNIDCVFFRGLSQSQNGVGKIESCSADSFGIAFAVQGEHLILSHCSAAHCLYGFTFNYYPSIVQGGSAYCHPMMLINPVEEMCLNHMYFGDNTWNQSVEIFNYHSEFKDGWFNLDGHYAQEKVIGSWRGYIDYVIQTFRNDQYSLKNNPTMKFWENGHGINCHSLNMAHSEIAPTNYYKTWAPNYGQQVFDSSLNKLAICTNTSPVTWVDSMGNTI